jgi:hypothetical protein
MSYKTKSFQRQPMALPPLDRFPEPSPGSPSPYRIVLSDLAAKVGDAELHRSDVSLPRSYLKGLDLVVEEWLVKAHGFARHSEAFALAIFWIRRLEGFSRIEERGQAGVAFVAPPRHRAARTCLDLIEAEPRTLGFLPSGFPVVEGRAA